MHPLRDAASFVIVVARSLRQPKAAVIVISCANGVGMEALNDRISRNVETGTVSSDDKSLLTRHNPHQERKLGAMPQIVLLMTEPRFYPAISTICDFERPMSFVAGEQCTKHCPCACPFAVARMDLDDDRYACTVN